MTRTERVEVSAPPPVRLGKTTAVGVDIASVDARLTFDLAARAAHAQAQVTFTVEGDGCPALDLRQSLGRLRLDGKALPGEAFPHRDLGGGEGAEMRILDKSLEAGTRHRIDVEYPLGLPDSEGAQPIEWGDGTVRFDLWMSDLKPGRYLEMWLPANLCHDRFSLAVDVEVVGSADDHVVISNGTQSVAGPGRWQIVYPATFTAVSPMLVMAPADQVRVQTGRVALAGRSRHVGVVTAKHADADADLAACHHDVAGWLAANAARYGRWAHGDRFTTVVWAAVRGMEYDGATTTSQAALEHEVFHSWFGRGVKPARASDGWIDEAWTVWATSDRFHEAGRFAEVELGLDQPPVLLYPPHPWSRHTPVESYREGAVLFAGIANLLGGAGRMRSAMAAWYRANVGGLVTTDGLERHLTRWSGVDVGPWFSRYVHGRDGT